ncbi:MAG: amidotransferase [Pseudomonadales bacterium]|nr:amidotransferase [Pseudomonadales bacterium]
MKVGILKADSVLDRFQPEFGDYPDMFRAALGAAGGEGVTYRTYDVVAGVYPGRPDECDGYIITGSKLSVYDDEPWIHALEDYVRLLDDTETKTVGICFGHQMVAQALGGKTEPAPGGWCVGVHEARIVESIAAFDPPRERVRLLSSHRDQVSRLPDRARVIAVSDDCPVSGMAVGDHMLTFQGHPEFCKGYSRALLEYRKDILAEKYVRGVSSLAESTDETIVSRWMLGFIAGR